jgi:hypothetical protein
MPLRKPVRNALAFLAGAFLCVLPAAAIEPAAALGVATLPPALIALEQKTEALQISSLRFSLRTSIKLPRSDRGLKCLLKFLGNGSETTGDATTNPAAAEASLELFGSRFTVRTVGSAAYADLPGLGRYDHGRPWVKLGKGGLAEIFLVNGHRPRSAPKPEPPPSTPKLAEPPFAGLLKLIAGATEVRELGPSTVDGQPVTRFLAALEPSQLNGESLASTARVKLPAPPPVSATLEASFAASGLPVQTVISVRSAGTTTTATLDIPAVNFPLVITAPPASKTTTIRRLHQIERHPPKGAMKTKEPRNPFGRC